MHWPPERRPETEERARLTLRPSAHRCAISRHSRSSASPRRFDTAAADQGSAGPLDPPHGIVARRFFNSICAGPPLTGRRTRCISIAFTFAAPRATSPPAPPPTLPKSASGPAGGGYFAGVPAPHRAACLAGNPAPCHAPHAAKIGLTGLPAPRPPRVTPHPAPSPTFLFFFPLRRWFHVAVRYFLRCGRVTDPPLQVQARGRGA